MFATAVVLVALPVAAILGVVDMRDPAAVDTTTIIEPPSSTAFITPYLPPPLSTTPAARASPPIQVTEPPAPVGINGLPFAPDGLDGCDTFTFYRIQWGLPATFDRLGWRESRCTNTPISRTGCCVGALQLHEIIFRDHRMLEPLAACDATWANVRGDTGDAWQRQMCAARALFDVAGYRPWSL